MLCKYERVLLYKIVMTNSIYNNNALILHKKT